MSKILLKIITPRVKSQVEDIESINLTTIDGAITVLPNHLPLISAIDVTKIVMKKGGLTILAFASDGLINVKEKEVILIVNAFEFKDEIDVNRAKASYERAYQRINSKQENIDSNRAQAALKRAITRLNICDKNI